MRQDTQAPSGQMSSTKPLPDEVAKAQWWHRRAGILLAMSTLVYLAVSFFTQFNPVHIVAAVLTCFAALGWMYTTIWVFVTKSSGSTTRSAEEN